MCGHQPGAPHYPKLGVGATSLGEGLRGVGGVLINPLPTAYHEHSPSEGNEISAICARWKLRDFVSESGGDCDGHINVLLSSL